MKSSRPYLGDNMNKMYAIGRRDENGGFGMWNGPNPSEREMLKTIGSSFDDFLIRFDDNEKGDPDYKILWRWHDARGEWIRHNPRVLHKRADAALIDQLQSQAVYIGRGSKWGNPFIIGKDGDREEVIIKYAERLLNDTSLLGAIGELTGKYLVCFCAPEPCHGDVLIELANPIDEGSTEDWKFKKYIPDPEDFEIKGQECERYLHAIRNTKEDFTDIDFFHAGFVRGLAWGIYKTTRHFDHLTKAQLDQYLRENSAMDWGVLEDDIPF